MRPFLSFYTPTYRRPKGLAACLASVGAQTLVREIEQVVVPDHVGRGIGGMYEQLRWYTPAIHGAYVHLLADDDVLAEPSIVEIVKARICEERYPDVLVVSAQKGGLVLPLDSHGPPICGRIDLGCLIVKSDIWRSNVQHYAPIYEGDFTFASALWNQGHRFVYARDLLFLVGGVSRGAAEAA